jgi:hypothetical protein
MLLDSEGGPPALPPPSRPPPACGGGGATAPFLRDLPTSRDLLALARETLLDELAPLLPSERRRDAHLVATVMAIAAREATGAGWQEEIKRELAEFYAPAGPQARRGDLKRRFAADLRNGAFETSPSQQKAARAILWRLTIDKLREGNPQFLAANGFKAGGQST